jgi:hypothetical protein
MQAQHGHCLYQQHCLYQHAGVISVLLHMHRIAVQHAACVVDNSAAATLMLTGHSICCTGTASCSCLMECLSSLI